MKFATDTLKTNLRETLDKTVGRFWLHLTEELELYHGQFRVYFRTLEGRVEATFTDASASSE